jgi:ABC-2 type transport system ATP-binding protein
VHPCLVLNKGIVLYSGSVHGMSSMKVSLNFKGRFRNLDSNSKTHPAIESIKTEEGKVFVYLKVP